MLRHKSYPFIEKKDCKGAESFYFVKSAVPLFARCMYIKGSLPYTDERDRNILGCDLLLPLVILFSVSAAATGGAFAHRFRASDRRGPAPPQAESSSAFAGLETRAKRF